LSWAGGHTSVATLDRPVARLEQLSYYPALVERICTLHAQGLKAPAIAQTLHAEGWRPPKRRTIFTRDTVHSILVRQGLWTPRRRTRMVSRRPHEWTILELSHHLQMPHQTLYAWVYKGISKRAGPRGHAIRCGSCRRTRQNWPDCGCCGRPPRW